GLLHFKAHGRGNKKGIQTFFSVVNGYGVIGPGSSVPGLIRILATLKLHISLTVKDRTIVTIADR
ncbi:hypothetical protein, partial [Acinetobacter baumannii]|uniref:hypothetical protein n=1 Tax=Acinetobacter baumannii TaxID=470 RepID=UPI001C07B81A